jgi:integrase
MARDRAPRLNGDMTDYYLKALRAWVQAHPPKKEYDLREGHGFGIRVRKTGVITFFYFYHFNGKRRFLNLGPYAPPGEARPPYITLSEARKRHSSAFGDVGAGIDPQATEPELPPEPEIMTVAKLITLYLESIKTVLVPRSVLQQTRALNNDMLKPWGERPVQEIFRPDAIALITEIQKRAPGQARNVKKAGQTMFEFAVARGWALFNPFAGVQKQVRGIAPRAGDRVLSDKEIVVLWEKVKETEKGRALLLILLTGQRPGEVTGMRWSEIEGDWWQINWRRIKTEINPNLTRAPSDHRVYLTPLAKSFLPTQTDSDYVFPAAGRGRGAGAEGGMRPATLSHELTEDKTHQYLGLPRWTPKDLRRTLRTGMARIGVPEEHAEAVLNHIQGGVKGIYNLYKYDNEKKAALIKWSDHIDLLIYSKKPAIRREVISLADD